MMGMLLKAFRAFPVAPLGNQICGEIPVKELKNPDQQSCCYGHLRTKSLAGRPIKMVTVKIEHKISKSSITSEKVYKSPSDVSLSTTENIQQISPFLFPPCLYALWQVRTTHDKTMYLPEDKQGCWHSGRGGFQEGEAIIEHILGFGFLNYHWKAKWPSWLLHF